MRQFSQISRNSFRQIPDLEHQIINVTIKLNKGNAMLSKIRHYIPIYIYIHEKNKFNKSCKF